MAYEKQTWVTGEVITEEKLNHMEDGIAGDSGELYFINVEATENGGKYTAELVGATIEEVLEKAKKASVCFARVDYMVNGAVYFHKTFIVDYNSAYNMVSGVFYNDDGNKITRATTLTINDGGVSYTVRTFI